MAEKSEASHEFWDSFIGSGSVTAECGCGRTHFITCLNSGFTWDEDDLAEYRKLEAENPGKYIPCPDDSVGSIRLNGLLIVYGCPCGMAAKYERVLLNEQSSILTFYKKVATKKRRELEETEAGLAAIK